MCDISSVFTVSLLLLEWNWIDRPGLPAQNIFHQKCMSCCRLQHNAVVLKVFKALNVFDSALHPRLSIIFCPLTYTLRSSAACLLNVPKVTTKKKRDGSSTALVLRRWNPLSLFIRETASVDNIRLKLLRQITILIALLLRLLVEEIIMLQPTPTRCWLTSMSNNIGYKLPVFGYCDQTTFVAQEAKQQHLHCWGGYSSCLVKHNAFVPLGKCTNSTLKEQEMESVPYHSLLLMWAYIQGFH